MTDPFIRNGIRVTAMMQEEIAMQRQYENIMKFLTSALAEMATVQKEIWECNGI
jgi:hypothetical protein